MGQGGSALPKSKEPEQPPLLEQSTTSEDYNRLLQGPRTVFVPATCRYGGPGNRQFWAIVRATIPAGSLVRYATSPAMTQTILVNDIEVHPGAKSQLDGWAICSLHDQEATLPARVQPGSYVKTAGAGIKVNHDRRRLIDNWCRQRFTNSIQWGDEYLQCHSSPWVSLFANKNNVSS